MSRVFGALILIVGLGTAAVLACSGVVLVGDGAVVVGGNEDNDKIDASMWAAAATESAHGAVYFGFYFVGLGGRYPGWYEMQGVNDQGLYFDLFSIPCAPGAESAPSPGLPTPSGRPAPEALERTMMTTCATVAEALAFLHARNYTRIVPCVQVLLVDRAGNAAVYTGTGDVFRTTPGFVVTNFSLTNPSLGEWPCERHTLATRMIAWDASPTLDRAAQILRAARYIPAPGASYAEGGTRYSVVCNLIGGIADVYLDGDFTRRARLDLAALWSTGLERTLLAGLSFTPSELP